jgi:hypothetical protein
VFHVRVRAVLTRRFADMNGKRKRMRRDDSEPGVEARSGRDGRGPEPPRRRQSIEQFDQGSAIGRPTVCAEGRGMSAVANSPTTDEDRHVVNREP